MTSHTVSSSNNLCEAIDAMDSTMKIYLKITYARFLKTRTDYSQGNSRNPRTMPSYMRSKIEAAGLHSSESYGNKVDKTECGLFLTQQERGNVVGEYNFGHSHSSVK